MTSDASTNFPELIIIIIQFLKVFTAIQHTGTLHSTTQRTHKTKKKHYKSTRTSWHTHTVRHTNKYNKKNNDDGNHHRHNQKTLEAWKQRQQPKEQQQVSGAVSD